MKSDRDIYKHYRDVLDESADPLNEQLVRDLDSLYKVEPPAHLATFSPPRPLTAVKSGRTGARRLVLGGLVAAVWVVAGLIALAVLVNQPAGESATPQAATNNNPAVSNPACADSEDRLACAFKVFGAPQVLERNLGREVQNTSVKAGDYTITIKRVYADNFVVLIGYTIKGPPNIRVGVGSITLYGGQPKYYLPIPQTSNASPTVNGETGFVYAVSTDNIKAGTTSLQVNFEISSINQTGLDNLPLPTPTIVPPTMRVTGIYPPESSSINVPPPDVINTLGKIVAEGPFRFQLDVPVIAGKEFAPLNSYPKDAKPPTTYIERVVITPVETRVYVRGVYFDTVAQISKVGGASATTSERPWMIADCCEAIFRFRTDLSQQRGDYVLTVKPETAGDPLRPTITPAPPRTTVASTVEPVASASSLVIVDPSQLQLRDSPPVVLSSPSAKTGYPPPLASPLEFRFTIR